MFLCKKLSTITAAPQVISPYPLTIVSDLRILTASLRNLKIHQRILNGSSEM